MAKTTKTVANDNVATANDNTAPARKKAYNVSMRVKSMDVRQDKNGNDYMRATVAIRENGEDRVRTMMARGKALAAVREMVEAAVGQADAIRVRVLYDKIPSGRLFFTAIALPRQARKKAA